MMERAFRRYPTKLEAGRAQSGNAEHKVSQLLLQSRQGFGSGDNLSGSPCFRLYPRHPPLITMENPQ